MSNAWGSAGTVKPTESGPQIPIRNFYYMLAYAFSHLNQIGKQWLAVESFDNAADLLAAILAQGLEHQIKRGLGKDYLRRSEALYRLKGKIDISQSLKGAIPIGKKLSCTYDQLSEDILPNQILKTVTRMFLDSEAVAEQQKRLLKRMLVYFKGVQEIDLSKTRWPSLQSCRFHRSYQFLLNVCRLAVEGMLLTDRNGKVRLTAFIDDSSLHRLFEKFVLRYYQRHYPELKAASAYVKWNLDQPNHHLLPRMQTDILLQSGTQMLIIDTKFYRNSLQRNRFGTYSQYSENMYQIYTYVKNQDVDLTGNVKGMILYAKTAANELPDSEYQLGGNTIYIKSLDLSGNFLEIEQQLKEIAGIVRIER